MRRVVVAAVFAALVVTTNMGTAIAQDQPEGGLSREPATTEASTSQDGPEASGKITFTDIIVSGRPDPGGND
jgi:hypothetical protein